MNKVHCPNCGAVLPAKNINIQTMMAVCAVCNTVFQFDADTLVKTKRQKLKAPDNIQVSEQDDRLEVSYHYRDHLGTIEIISIIACGVVMLMSLIGTALLLPRLPLVGLALLAVPLFTLYLMLAAIFNEVRVVIDAQQVRCRERPLYSFYNRTFERDTVVRAYSRADTAHGEHSINRQHVMLLLHDGQEKRLVQYTQPYLAAYIVQLLNTVLLEEDDADALVSPVSDPLSDTPDGEIDPEWLAVGDDGELIRRDRRGT